MRVFPQFKTLMAQWPRVEAMPYAKEVLQVLHSGWTVALATNAADSNERDIQRALSRAGLGEWIDRIYCYQKIGLRKPSLEFFTYILEDLALPPSKTIMVGDDFHGDILGANSAGIRAIWYNRSSPLTYHNEMHTTIHDLRDLPEAIEQLTKIKP